MSEKEREFFDSCDSFKDYANIDEYKDDICTWLTLSDWKYKKSRAKELIKANEAYIEKAYENKEPAADAGAEIGFCCG